MKETYVIKGKKVTFTDNDFIARGGQGNVFRCGDMAVKIYHDKSGMIPLDKMRELMVLDRPTILGPKNIVTNIRDEAVGYTMPYVEKTNPLCQLFVRNFREDNGISPQDIVDLVKIIQETISFIHSNNVVIVDGNEMNYLVSDKFDMPYFLDVDSWATPRFPKATVIMESVRDRLVKHGQYNRGSDWFAFAVVITQMYLGIHPYRGNHPKYSPKEWIKRMDDGVSIFEKGVKLPPSVQDFSVIPQKHRDWLERVFVKNERSIPPFLDVTTVAAAALARIIKSIGHFEVSEWMDLLEEPRSLSMVGEYMYFSGKEYVVNNQKPKDALHSSSKYKRVYVAAANTGNPVYCKWTGSEVECYADNDVKFGTQNNVVAVFNRGDKVYTISNGRIYCLCFTELSRGQFMLAPRSIGRVLENAGRVYPGIVVQDIVGKTWVMIPYTDRHNYFQHIPELDEYRITDARSEKNIAVFMAEKNGEYHRIVLVFDPEFKSYTFRIENNVQKLALNFTVLQNGVCVMPVDNNEIEVFKDNGKISRYDQSPIDTTMKLFNIESQVGFIQGTKVYKLKMK